MTPTSGRSTSIERIEPLTAIRGFAAWWVVAFHYKAYLSAPSVGAWSDILRGGYMAVDLFFILSGFVITLNYLNRLAQFNYHSVLSFLVARISRLYPLHLFMCGLFLLNPLAILLVSKSGLIGDRYAAGAFMLNLALLHNWGFTDSLTWNIPSWSISTEWFAYIIFPVLALVCTRAIKTVRIAFVVIVVLMTSLALLFDMIGAWSLGADIPTMGLVRCLMQFAIGSVICQLYLAAGAPTSNWSTALIVLAIVLLSWQIATEIPDFLIAPAAFSVLIFGLCNSSSPISRVLTFNPLMFLGKISYSTYMVHYFVMDWVKFLLVDEANTLWLKASVTYFGMTLLCSVLLYRFVELPGRRFVRSRYNTVMGLANPAARLKAPS